MQNLLKVNSKKTAQLRKWAREVNIFHQIRYTDGKISIWKDTPHHVTKEILIKTVRYLYTPNRVAKIQNIDNTKSWWWQSNRNSPSLLVGYKIAQPFKKTSTQLLMNLNILLSCDPAITLLSVNRKELKIYVHTKACTQIFTTTLFIKSKLGSNKNVLK